MRLDQMCILVGVLFFLNLSSETCRAQDAQRCYFIGNSLTNDLVKFGGLEDLASSVSTKTLLASQHVQCNTSLTGILATANDQPDVDHTCTGSKSKAGADYDLGNYPIAFDSQIDTLILQPFQNATLRQEIESTKIIIDALRSNPVNADTQIFIYQTWDLRRSSATFMEDWYGRVAELDEEFRPCKHTYEIFFNELTQAGYDFKVIPVGQSFANASEALSNGSLGNIDDGYELFRDFIHGSNAGRYLAALVASEVLMRESFLNVEDADQLPAFIDGNHAKTANAVASAALRDIAHRTVVSVDIDLGGVDDRQRSMLRSLELSFLDTISVGSGAFELVKRGAGGGTVDVTSEVDNSGPGSTVVLTFSGPFTEFSGSLVDGNYQLTVNGNGITDSSGIAFDIDGDGNPGGVLVFGDEEDEAFYRLFGDVDQDRVVNISDFLRFRNAYLLIMGDPSYDESLDHNLDGLINIFDYLTFRRNYLKTMPFNDSSSSRSFRALGSGESSGRPSKVR